MADTERKYGGHAGRFVLPLCLDEIKDATLLVSVDASIGEEDDLSGRIRRDGLGVDRLEDGKDFGASIVRFDVALDPADGLLLARLVIRPARVLLGVRS